MVRQVVIAAGERHPRLLSGGAFPQDWPNAGGSQGLELPLVVSVEDLEERIDRRDEAWLSRTFLEDDGAVVVVWLEFVPGPAEERAALFSVQALQNRLRASLQAALGYRMTEVSDLLVLVDDEADDNLDDDHVLVNRVCQSWSEVRMNGSLLYMGPRLNAVGESALGAKESWPVAVGNLLLALHLSDDRDWIPDQGVHVWRSIAWRPWSEAVAVEMRRELSERTREALDWSKGDGGRSGHAEEKEKVFRETLEETGGVPLESPPSPTQNEIAEPDRKTVRTFDPSAVLASFDASYPTAKYATKVRLGRQKALDHEYIRQRMLWREAWTLAEVSPLGPRRVQQLLDQGAANAPEDGNRPAHHGVESTASWFARVQQQEQMFLEQREELARCGEEISAAERGRIGPMARLAVATAVSALLVYSIWLTVQGALGLTSWAIQLIIAVVLGGLCAVLGMSWAERRALRSAREDFLREGVPSLERARGSVAFERARLLAAASERRFECGDRETKRELRLRLDRLGGLVEEALGLEHQGRRPAPTEDQGSGSCVRGFFLPHLIKEPVGDQSDDLIPAGQEQEMIRDVVEHMWRRWDAFVLRNDPHKLGALPAQGLLAELAGERARIGRRFFSRRLRQMERVVREVFIGKVGELARSPFLEGLSHRQQGHVTEPHCWSVFDEQGESWSRWSSSPGAAKRLAELGFVALQLDVLPLTGPDEAADRE